MPYVFSFVVYIYDLMYRSLHVLCPFIRSLHVRFNVLFPCAPALSAQRLRSAADSPELDGNCGATRGNMLGRPVAKRSGVCGKVHARCRGTRPTCRQLPTSHSTCSVRPHTWSTHSLASRTPDDSDSLAEVHWTQRLLRLTYGNILL